MAWAFAMIFTTSATSAQSNASCTTFSEIGGRSSENDLTDVASALFPGGHLGTSKDEHQGTCEISSSDQYALTCTWQFPYRSELATNRFDTVRGLISACSDDPAGFTKDQNVNHPDYYEAYYYGAGNNTLSASIKDKGALQKTLVFLRMK
jgi:hypothetical protein